MLYLLNIIAEADVNLVAHNIVDASDFGIVHMLWTGTARRSVRDAGITTSSTTVLYHRPQRAGAFVRRVLQPLADAGQHRIQLCVQCTATGEARIVLKV